MILGESFSDINSVISRNSLISNKTLFVSLININITYLEHEYILEEYSKVDNFWHELQ